MMNDTYTPEQIYRQVGIWDRVSDSINQAHGIAWDGCHKIYVLMDSQQMRLMREYGYHEGESKLLSADDFDPDMMLNLVRTWFEESCSLRFVQQVETNHEDPNAGFENLIAQGEEAFLEGYEEDDLL